MYVLGISAFVKNTAACLLKDGKLVAFSEEERFLRIKGAHDIFPSNAVKYCLSEAKIGLSKVDKIAIGWDCNKYKFKMPLFMANSWLKYSFPNIGSGSSSVISDLIRYNPQIFNHKTKLELTRLFSTTKIPPIEFVPHHMAHAASCFWASGFDDSKILVIDGSGEEKSTSILTGNGLEIKEIENINLPNSLGWFYASITSYLGFIPYRQEGQVMGLAPYGKYNYKLINKFKKIIEIGENEKYRVNPSFNLLGTHSYNEYFSDELVNLLGKPRFPGEAITQRHKDIAFSVQFLLEKAVLHIVSEMFKDEHGSKNLCLSGGVSLNCKMNGEIAQSGLIENLFVQPVSSDAGSSFGAAMIVSQKAGFDPRFKMNHTYWGPGFSNIDIKKSLDLASIKYKKVNNISKKAAGAITKGKIVAWFQGRMEVGPRALGNRSIIASVQIKGNKDYINKKVKHRQYWRPFCPSILEEKANMYLKGLSDNKDESRFMIVTYKVLKINKKIYPKLFM